MNSRVCIQLGAWVAMWFAFNYGHPVGYLIVIIGFAASVAIAAEDLREDDSVEIVDATAAAGEQPVVTPAAQAKVLVRGTGSRRSKRTGAEDVLHGGLRPAT